MGDGQKGNSALGMAASWCQASPVQLPPPQVLKSCPRPWTDALEEASCNEILTDPRAKSRICETGKLHGIRTGFELFFELSGWGDVAHAATQHQGGTVARNLLAVILATQLCCTHSASGCFFAIYLG